MDLQVILIFILALLTINLLIVSFYILTVLKEVKTSMRKITGVVESISEFGANVSRPLGSVVSLILSLVEGYKTVQSIKSLHEDERGFNGKRR